jgi:voltage-gated potassium channel
MGSGGLVSFFTRHRALRFLSKRYLLDLAVLVVGLAAMSALSSAESRAYAASWQLVLWVCFGIFAVEWAMRTFAAARSGGLAGYLFSASGIIDALAVVPIALALALGTPPQTAWLLGALWLLKLAPVSPGLALLGRVIALEAKPLASLLVIFLVILFLAAVTLHVLERDVQPQQFGDLPRALWWAVTTLTTTGYGDVVPSTGLGRFVASGIMICGLGVFGLLTGILATGFVAEGRRRDFIQNWNLIAQVPFFRCLDPRGIIEITRMLRRVDMPERTMVVRRGRRGDCMYFIARGEVEVQIAPRPVRLGTGAFFGELALLGDGLRTATVVTSVPTTLLVLDLSDFHAVTAQYPELAAAVAGEAERRRAELQGARMEVPEVATRSAASRAN